VCRIGTIVVDPPIVLAPMAAVTNPPYRKLCREQGAGLVVTEMASARGIVDGDRKTWSLVDIQPDEHPIAVQLFGADPEELARAAVQVVDVGADVVDVNMGCPMKKVVRTGRGAALLRDPARVEAIVSAMTEAVSVPVTAKIRAGWDDANAVEVARALESGGASAVTIHGRTRSDLYAHHADLDVIADVKRSVGITVIGNGDVCDVASCDRMFERTGCDAVMVARGCLGNPWLFAELRAHLAGTRADVDRSPHGVRQMVLRHLALYAESLGPQRAALEFRKHALWYFKGSPAEPAFRALLPTLTTLEHLYEAVDTACAALRPASLSTDARECSG
jgi:nifR3 family TIM-barrel protein